MRKLHLKTILFSKRTFIILCIVLLLANGGTVWFFLATGNQPQPNKYPLIDVARQYVSQQDFVVNTTDLRDKMLDIVNAEPDNTVSVYFEFLNTGANISLNPDATFYPASLVKLASAMAVMKKVEDGTWSLDSRLVLSDQDKDSRFGTLYQEPTGTSFSIRELLMHLLIDSDTTAHNMFMRNLSSDDLANLEDAIGLDSLFDDSGDVSAKEYSRMFRALYSSSYLHRSNSEQLLSWLSQSSFNEYLQSGVPSGVTFAHKIGEDDVSNTYLDSGIVYTAQRPYLITVMINGHSKADAENIMKQLSQDAYQYVSTYQK